MKEILSRLEKGEGKFKKVTIYLKGWHPDKGKLTMGWSGKETRVTYDAVVPDGTYHVQGERSRHPGGSDEHVGSGRTRT